MDRRVVAGLAGFLLVSGAEVCPAQSLPGRDPSAQPPVGLSPLPSIGDSINNTSLGAVPPAYAKLPTSPIGNGPAATIPRAPVMSSPVGLSPIESIHQSINRGLGNPGTSSLFRNSGARAVVPSSSPPAIRPQATVTPNPDASSLPASLPALPPVETEPPIPAGRLAPFAQLLPELPRPQSDPIVTAKDSPGTGRPAPFADGQPQIARPQAPSGDQASNPRPRAEPSNPPSFRPPDVVPIPAEVPQASTPPDLTGPPPVELPTPPPIEPAKIPTAAATPPPMGSDPLQGMELVATVKPPPAISEPPAERTEPEPGSSDSEVKQTSQDSTEGEDALRMKTSKPKVLQFAAIRAAAVGDQIITFNELDTAVNEEMRERMAGHEGPMTREEAQQLKQIKNMVAASVLDRLINQSLVLQQAKHKMQKNDKAKQQFDETINKIWLSDEVPPLLRKYGCSNVYELKSKLASEGRSYEAMKEVFRKKILFNEFLRAEIRHKLTCDLAEQRSYYNEHLKDYEQPARMTWREVEISFAKYPNRAAARKKAEDVLARLLHDENFEAVAKASSDGPTASKGGVYVDMQPGSYGIPVVNDELNRIPIGQVSQILEAPGSFHIVRVDSRREKGPLRFDEVQDKIKDRVFEQNFHLAVDDYLGKLRAKTLIRTMFDQTESDPNLARRNNDPAVRQASGTK
jgi:PPIC-type PPIASE domain